MSSNQPPPPGGEEPDATRIGRPPMERAEGYEQQPPPPPAGGTPPDYGQQPPPAAPAYGQPGGYGQPGAAYEQPGGYGAGYGQGSYGQPPGGDPLAQPLRGADPRSAVARFFKKYAVFSGRASRSEFWWTMLFLWIVNFVLNTLGRSSMVFSVIGLLFSLAVLVPQLALGARRLHDTNRSGWWQLLYLIPIIGWIVLIVFWALEEKPEGQRFDA